MLKFARKQAVKTCECLDLKAQASNPTTSSDILQIYYELKML